MSKQGKWCIRCEYLEAKVPAWYGSPTSYLCRYTHQTVLTPENKNCGTFQPRAKVHNPLD